jgi:hypothetical protein
MVSWAFAASLGACGEDVQSTTLRESSTTVPAAGTVAMADGGFIVPAPPRAGSIAKDECAHELIATQGMCEITLPAASWVEHLDCMARVMLGTRTLPCGGPDGWELSSPTQLTLHGSSCDAVRSGSFDAATLEIDIPCHPIALDD